MANKLSVSRSLIGAWEEDRSMPKYELLIKISSYFNLEDPTLLITHEMIPGVRSVRKIEERDKHLWQAIQDIRNILKTLPEQYL